MHVVTWPTTIGIIRVCVCCEFGQNKVSEHDARAKSLDETVAIKHLRVHFLGNRLCEER